MPDHITFVGHTERWEALARAFGRGALAQTILISGPPEVGKWPVVHRLAQLLLCSQPGTDEEGVPSPCETCRVCHQVAIGTFPDLSVFRPLVSETEKEKDWVVAPRALEGSVVTVAVARKFAEEAMAKPMFGKRKVFVLRGADRMTPSAQNCLLKTFEEPAPSLTIILIADNPSHLLPTILSRSWQVPLGPVADDSIAAWLEAEFASAPVEMRSEALRVAAGRPVAAGRELLRLLQAIAPGKKGRGSKGAADEPEPPPGPRFALALELIERIGRCRPVAALALTEEALRLSRAWWAQDMETAGPVEAPKDASKGEAKVLRSAVARFLDELSNAYRYRWHAEVGGSEISSLAPSWADGLDQIRKTRNYILRNANTNLALDVMFGRLIALRQQAGPMRNARVTKS